MKVCCKCKEEKDLTEFGKCKTRKDGHQYQCKQCRRRYRQNNKDKISEQGKLYRQKNKEKISEKNRQYREVHRERIKEYEKLHRQNNKDKIKEYKKLYYQNNKDKISEQGKLYRQENEDKIKERKKLYHEKNKDKIKERVKLYYQKNKEKYSAYRDRRRARKRENGYEYFTHKQLVEHWISTGIDPEKCFYCKDRKFEEVDHYIPIAKGGPHYKENLRPACMSCNRSKQDKLPEVWLSQQQQNKCIEINQEQ